jgi:opacity protein-like surface antigen
MNHAFIPWYRSSNGNFLKRCFAVAFALLISCSAAAFAQDAVQPTNPAAPAAIRTTHLMGFENTSNNAHGTLSFQGDGLVFQKGDKSPVLVKVSSIQDVFLGDQSKQVGGIPMTLGKAAVPFGGGRAISLFAHKKYDTLTLEYVDTNGGIHGAIFELRKGQAEGLRNELIARGAHVSHSQDESTKQSTAEVSNENK